MLITAGCGQSGGSVVQSSSPTATKAPPDQTCSRQKNPPQRQPAHSSGTGWANPHGYGVAEWTGPASSLGATIDSVNLKVPDPTHQFLDNELWLSDNSNNWVETGYGTFNGGVSYTFWADNRPNPSPGTYYLYILDQVSTSTPLDYRITGNGQKTFTIYVAHNPNTQNCQYYSVQSTNNPLDTNSATSDIGMEIYDSTSSAPYCNTSLLADPSPNYTNLGLDPNLNNSMYTLIEATPLSINASMSPGTGAPTTLTTSC
jgi:hypothetical protein